ncbi:MAG: PQQ-binding-like beta-propeller repeat protein, partial [Planctomycetes bacterium]|nr:PQQ-binding-like beta-propeller repeat protein [Planctomycetota bacterium]
MAEYPSLKRGLIAVLTLFLVGVPIAYWLSRGGDLSKLINPAPANAQGAKDTGDWHMYGGSPARNMANTRVKGLPVEWDIKKKVNILWVADLGSKSYGGPTVAGGHVLIGTNNQGLRDPKLVKQKVDPLGKPVLKDGKPVMEPIDLGIVMSFAEADGKFEWQ